MFNLAKDLLICMYHVTVPVKKNDDKNYVYLRRLVRFVEITLC